MNNVSIEALKYARERVEAFAQVNLGRPQNEKVESIRLFWQAVGVTPEAFDEFPLLTDSLIRDERHHGPFMLGVIFGLYVREFDEA